MEQADIKDALRRRAVGFETDEVVEEYSVSDGEPVLVKRKVTKKAVPPDISAAKLLLESETPWRRGATNSSPPKRSGCWGCCGRRQNSFFMPRRQSRFGSIDRIEGRDNGRSGTEKEGRARRARGERGV